MKYKILILLTVFMSSFACAQTAEKMLKELQNRFYSINDMSADFTQLPGSLKGRFFYKKGNKYHLELKNSVIVSDGQSVWNYTKKNKKVVINDLSGSNSPFSLENIVVNYPKRSSAENSGKEKIDGVECNVLKLTSKNDRNFKNAKIWYSSDNFIKKVEIQDAQGNKFGFQLSNVKINGGLSDSRFSFQVPEGIEIIDLR